MPPGGQTLRLRAALEDFVSSQSGDAGQMRSAQTGGKAVQLAQQLLGELGGGEEQDQATPGQRARARATGGGSIQNAAAKAREMLGGR